jgi:hypothetical protein
MLFVCIDNKLSELDRAGAAVVARGHACKRIEAKGLLADYIRQIEEADVILTDLFFNPSHPDSGNHAKYAASEPPAGLLVALHALKCNKVVVICTDEGEKTSHHSEGMSWIYDCYVSSKATTDAPSSGYTPRFPKPRLGWNDRKDWSKAVAIGEYLVQLEATKQSPAS